MTRTRTGSGRASRLDGHPHKGPRPIGRTEPTAGMTPPHPGAAPTPMLVPAVRIRRAIQWSRSVAIPRSARVRCALPFGRCKSQERSGGTTSSRRSTPRPIGGRPTSTPVTRGLTSVRQRRRGSERSPAPLPEPRHRADRARSTASARCWNPWRGRPRPPSECRSRSPPAIEGDRAVRSDAWRPVRDLSAAGPSRPAGPDDRPRRYRGCRARRGPRPARHPRRHRHHPGLGPAAAPAGPRWRWRARREPARSVADGVDLSRRRGSGSPLRRDAARPSCAARC